jgi:hypothetical protein
LAKRQLKLLSPERDEHGTHLPAAFRTPQGMPWGVRVLQGTQPDFPCILRRDQTAELTEIQRLPTTTGATPGDAGPVPQGIQAATTERTSGGELSHPESVFIQRRRSEVIAQRPSPDQTWFILWIFGHVRKGSGQQNHFLLLAGLAFSLECHGSGFVQLPAGSNGKFKAAGRGPLEGNLSLEVLQR